MSALPVTLEWGQGVSSNTGSGTLAVGKTLCGEGLGPKAVITFADAFSTEIRTFNQHLGYPFVSFNRFPYYSPAVCTDGVCTGAKRPKKYASATYSQGETVGSDVEGHHFAVTRNTDDDWIQFSVVILT